MPLYRDCRSSTWQKWRHLISKTFAKCLQWCPLDERYHKHFCLKYIFWRTNNLLPQLSSIQVEEATMMIVVEQIMTSFRNENIQPIFFFQIVNLASHSTLFMQIIINIIIRILCMSPNSSSRMEQWWEGEEGREILLKIAGRSNRNHERKRKKKKTRKIRLTGERCPNDDIMTEEKKSWPSRAARCDERMSFCLCWRFR